MGRSFLFRTPINTRVYPSDQSADGICNITVDLNFEFVRVCFRKVADGITYRRLNNVVNIELYY